MIQDRTSSIPTTGHIPLKARNRQLDRSNIRGLQVMMEVLRYARYREYTGWDLYDGESSRILELLPIDNKWINIAFQQLPRRLPINIRPLLLIEKNQSFLGSSLFTIANFRAFELTDEKRYLREGEQLADWLIENRSIGYSGFGGGHQHPLQSIEGYRTYPNIPDVVDTAHGTRALLYADEYLGEQYSELAVTAADLILDDLSYRTVEDGAKIKYKATESGDSTTLNANAIGARCLLDIYAVTGDESLRSAATKILEFVVSKRHPSGGWMYTDPPSAGFLKIDNFHNGFIIECLMDYQEITRDDRFEEVIDTAVDFYRDVMFEANGAPNFDTENAHPKNIHDVAEGIIVFSRRGDLDTATRIYQWGIEHLYAGDGCFYFEKGRFLTKRITYMRWCQAWMAYALSEYCMAQAARLP